MLIPQMRVARRLRFAVSPLRWMYLMSDPTLPALPVSNVSFHASRLPADGSLWSRCDCLFLRFGFKRRQAFRGLHTDLLLYLFLSSSSSHSLPLCSPFQVFPGVSESLSSLLFLSSRGRWEQTAWQFSLFFFSLFTFLFSVCGCSLCVFLSRRFYFSPNWVERKPWSTILKEWSRLWCVSFSLFFQYQQTRSLVDLADCRYPPQRWRLRFRPFIRPQMQTGTRTQAPKHIQRPNSAKVFKAIWWMCGAALSVIPHLTLPSKT